MFGQMWATRIHTKFYEDPIWGHNVTARVQGTELRGEGMTFIASYKQVERTFMEK
jgi:hypothetical protein